jgi:hypothetical protein
VNQNQKLATIAALGLLLLTVIFAPFEVVTKNQWHHVASVQTEYRFILAPPERVNESQVRFHVAPVLVSWAVIGLLYGGTVLLLRKA